MGGANGSRECVPDDKLRDTHQLLFMALMGFARGSTHPACCISQGFGCMPCKKRSGLSGPMGISSKLIICALPKGSFSSIS
jgi:hypothetical protein